MTPSTNTVASGILTKGHSATPDKGQNVTAPIVPMPRHRALAWSVSDRANMAKRLAELGTNITEASDARELAGRPRLSESSAEQRHYAPLWFLGAAGKAALAQARAHRALLETALATLDAGTVAEARHMLGLRRKTLSTLRLCEIAAVYSQSRVIELAAEARQAAERSGPTCPECHQPCKHSGCSSCTRRVHLTLIPDHGFESEVTAAWRARVAA
jgi:hypothetical protein